MASLSAGFVLGVVFSLVCGGATLAFALWAANEEADADRWED